MQYKDFEEAVTLGRTATDNAYRLETMIDELHISEDAKRAMKLRIGWMEALCLRIGYLRDESQEVSKTFEEYVKKFEDEEESGRAIM